MPTIESIQTDIDEAVTPGFRARLIARGQARAMIWRDGVLPPGAPAFSPQLSYDLHSYGYSLLELGLRLRELGGDPARARVAFEQAATALEAVMAKGARGEIDRDFHFVMAAAAYHLAHLSARAYSLLTIVQAEDNFSLIERVLAQLILRDLGALQTTVLDFRLQGSGSDATSQPTVHRLSCSTASTSRSPTTSLERLRHSFSPLSWVIARSRSNPSHGFAKA
jgi:hypothetical protein